MQDIIKGFIRFQREVFPQQIALFKRLSTAQSPSTLFVTCSDSRVVPELLTQVEPGALFVIRNAGNIVPSYGPEPGGVSATVEYAGAVLGVLVTLSSVGAGALGVTLLLLLYPRVSMKVIVGSDIAHAVPLTLVAGAGHWWLGSVDVPLLASLLSGSIPGIILGSYLSARVPDAV